MKIFQSMTFHIKLKQVQNHCHIGFGKVGGFNMVLGGKIQNLVLFGYGLLDKIDDKIKRMVLQIVLIIILEKSKLIHLILCILKNINFS